MSCRWKLVWRIHGKKGINKINGKKKFIYGQNRYLSYPLKRMLCNSLIQPHLDFACYAWYPKLSMSLKNNLETAQSACIRFWFGMETRSHVGLYHLKNNNWLPIKNRIDQLIAVTAYNFKNNLTCIYVRYIYSKFFSSCKNNKIYG